MSDDVRNFCTRCGHMLSDGTRFCPECGLRVPGANPEQVEEERQAIRDAMGRQLRWATAVMVIYSVPFLVLGIYAATNIGSMTDLIVNDPNFSGYADMYGLTYDEVYSYFEYAALGFIASSVCGLVCAVCCWRRAHFWAAFLLCMAAILLGSMGFISMFLGFIALWLIIGSKPGFREYSDRLEEELSRME